MKRSVVAATLIAVMLTFCGGVAQAHDDCLTIGPAPGGIVLWCPDAAPTPTPEPTVMPTAEPTATPLPPTVEPTVEPTASPVQLV